MRSLWWAIALAACGDVQKVPDAAVPDAYQADAAVEVTCATGENVCNGICTDPATDDLHCGNCMTQCSPTHGCLNGSCVPRNTACTRVREIDPDAPDGLYTNPNNGTPFFCDFTNGQTLEGLAMGEFDVTYAGYSLVTFEQLSKPAYQAAFIAFYNRQGGMPLLASWVSDNCCYSTTGGMDWHFGGSYLYPSNGGAETCSPPAPGYVGGPWRLYNAISGLVLEPPLPEDFFVTNEVTQADPCVGVSNPGIFWKARNSLN